MEQGLKGFDDDDHHHHLVGKVLIVT